MSQGALFLLRPRSARDAWRVFGPRTSGWDLLDSSLALATVAEEDPDSKPAIVLSTPDYFPYDADELERYRQRLLDEMPAKDLAALLDDARGMFVFDWMMLEELEERSYDAVIAACSDPAFGLWFDPLRPIHEQRLPFAARAAIDLAPFVAELGEKPRARTRGAKRPGKETAGKTKAKAKTKTKTKTKTAKPKTKTAKPKPAKRRATRANRSRTAKGSSSRRR